MWKLLFVGKNYGNLFDEKLEKFGKGTLRVIRFTGMRVVFEQVAKKIHKHRSVVLCTHWERTAREPKSNFRAPPRKEHDGMKYLRLEVEKMITKTRARVEHVFGAIKHGMGCVLHRGIGIQRA